MERSDFNGGAREHWEAVLARDGRYDGAFVYAVRTTGIYCRPSCASRKPRRKNVRFYPLPEVAEGAGYRPCRRCRPHLHPVEPAVEQVRAVCRYIETHLDESLTMERLAEVVHLSPSHLQRRFRQVVGLTPAAYIEARRMTRVRETLGEGGGISQALYEAGWGSPSRLYDRADDHLGMTPGAYRNGGRNMEVRYTVVPSPLGQLLVGATSRGICAVTLGDDEATLEADLRTRLRAATLVRDDGALRQQVETILAYLAGGMPHLDLPLDVQGSAFQARVWAALRAIPYGETRSYQQVAEAIGQPTATRAVARACATNPAALLIPCHRVTRKDGGLSGYRWGVERKRSLLETEAQAAREQSAHG